MHDARRLEWAFERAEFRNANFGTDGVPWEPDDFLGRGNRGARTAEKAQNDMQVARLNASLADLKDEDVPEWAKQAKRADDERKRREALNGRA